MRKEKQIGAVNHEKVIDHQEKITQTAPVKQNRQKIRAPGNISVAYSVYTAEGSKGVELRSANGAESDLGGKRTVRLVARVFDKGLASALTINFVE